MRAYAFLLMAVGSFGMLGVAHKIADHRGCRAEAINVFLFLGAAIAMALISLTSGHRFDTVPAIASATALCCGFLASLAILNFQHGIRYGKISTSWLVINLSAALPTVLSIILYHEGVSARRAAGLGLAIVALLLLWLERRRDEAAS